MPSAGGGAAEAAERGVGLAAAGRWIEAVPWLERAVALESAPAYLANLAVAYARSGLDLRAEEVFQRALGLAPHDALLQEDFAAFRAGRGAVPGGSGARPGAATASSAVRGAGPVERPGRRPRPAPPPWLCSPPGGPGDAECSQAAVRSAAAYATHRLGKRESYVRWAAREAAVARAGGRTLEGYCAICREVVAFALGPPEPGGEGSSPRPNWRESLVCPGCGLNNRVRAALHVLEGVMGAGPDSRVYIAEQATPAYALLAQRYPGTVGSEYVEAGAPPGSRTAAGFRHEDLTALSFPAGSFDHVIALDVLEHLPDHMAALGECRRILAPGGWLLLTVPFAPLAFDHAVRASLDGEGRIVHHLPPEYHGDPVRKEGCLCFRVFGWQLLGDLRRAGFAEATAHLYWSAGHGYLGGEQILFAARRDAAPRRSAQEAA